MISLHNRSSIAPGQPAETVTVAPSEEVLSAILIRAPFAAMQGFNESFLRWVGREWSTNAQEYVAGTDPRDARSFLKVEPPVPGSAVVVGFEAVSNRTYTVQSSDLAPGGPWQSLTNLSSQPASYTAVVTDPSPGDRRFYRLVTLRRP